MFEALGFFPFPGSSWPDLDPLILDEEEKRVLAEYDQKISEIRRRIAGEVFTAQKARIEYLRSLAYKKGIAAVKLEDLESCSKRPFVEVKPYGPRMAVVKEDLKAGIFRETAYFCNAELPERVDDTLDVFIKEDKVGCGWVKGEPVQSPYYDEAPACVSAGYHCSCKICGMPIGRIRISGG